MAKKKYAKEHHEREQQLIDRIDELREQISGYMETLDAMNAILTVAIRKTGTLVLPMEDVKDIMLSGDYAVGEFDAEKREYKLHMPEAAADDK